MEMKTQTHLKQQIKDKYELSEISDFLIVLQSILFNKILYYLIYYRRHTIKRIWHVQFVPPKYFLKVSVYYCWQCLYNFQVHDVKDFFIK